MTARVAILGGVKVGLEDKIEDALVDAVKC